MWSVEDVNGWNGWRAMGEFLGEVNHVFSSAALLTAKDS